MVLEFGGFAGPLNGITSEKPDSGNSRLSQTRNSVPMTSHYAPEGRAKDFITLSRRVGGGLLGCSNPESSGRDRSPPDSIFAPRGSVRAQRGIRSCSEAQETAEYRDRASPSIQLEYGMDALEIHRDAIEPGENVLIVDDVLATGPALLHSRRDKVGGKAGRECGGAWIRDRMMGFLDGQAKLPGQLGFERCSTPNKRWFAARACASPLRR